MTEVMLTLLIAGGITVVAYLLGVALAVILNRAESARSFVTWTIIDTWAVVGIVAVVWSVIR